MADEIERKFEIMTEKSEADPARVLPEGPESPSVTDFDPDLYAASAIIGGASLMNPHPDSVEDSCPPPPELPSTTTPPPTVTEGEI